LNPLETYAIKRIPVKVQLHTVTDGLLVRNSISGGVVVCQINRPRRKKKIVVSGNPTDPSFYPPTLKILWTYLC